MIVTVDWGNKVVNVARSEMLLIQSVPVEVRQLDLNDFRLALHDVQDDVDGIVYDAIHAHNPSVTVAGVALAKVVEIINGYTITFEDGLYNVNIVGGNSNVADRVNKNQVGVNTANSAGLQDSTSLQAASFADVVAVDQVGGIDSTTFPAGTKGYPVNSITNARIIMAERNIDTIYAVGNLTLDTGDDVSNIIVAGQNPTKTTVTILTGADTLGCEVRECTVTGVLDGGAVLRRCLIDTLNYFNGFCVDCTMNGTITLDGGADALFLHCTSGVPGANTPVIDMGGTGQALGMRNYHGGITITNKTGVDPISVDMSSGQIIFDATVANTQDIYVRGIARIIDNSTGVDKIDSVGLLSGEVTVRGTGCVILDVVNGFAGVDARNGTSVFPSNNLTDAVAIAHLYGILKIQVIGAVTTAGTEDLTDFILSGDVATTSHVTVTAGTTTTNTTFRDVYLSGTLSSDGAVVERCLVGNLSGMQNYLYNCFMIGTINLSGDTTAAHCAIAPSAVDQMAHFHFSNLAVSLIISDWGAGIIMLNDMVIGSFAGLSGTGGRVQVGINNTGGDLVYGGGLLLNPTNLQTLDSIIDSSVAGESAVTVWEAPTRELTSAIGTLTAQEVWEYVDRTLTSVGQGGGATAQEVWEYATRTLTEGGGGLTPALEASINQIEADTAALRDYNEGSWKIIGTQMIFYRRDNTEFMRFDLLDEAGQPNARGAMQRVKTI